MPAKWHQRPVPPEYGLRKLRHCNIYGSRGIAGMHLKDFDFELPDELIAQSALQKRDASRMLVVNRERSSFCDSAFIELPNFLRPGDLVVLNNTRVFPARLVGKLITGARIELFLVNELADGNWRTLARPAKRLTPGKKIVFDDRLSAEVIERTEDGKVDVRFECSGDFFAIVNEIGRTPLPPYIRRDESNIDTDRERYQTVYAKARGAIAAPTAGLHFTPDTFAELQKLGVELCEITLHVGYGTFEPVRVDDLSQHRVSPESVEVSEAAAEQLNKAKAERRRIVSIGTTTTRALESALATSDEFRAGGFLADLTITPGDKFKAVDALLTNFHLPESSLLVLVSAFAGHELIMSAYRHAVAEKYRFYSYGDCMFIE
jgi:S-adenosylmethionine:tRNA ribosyltransferase-isomerase